MDEIADGLPMTKLRRLFVNDLEVLYRLISDHSGSHLFSAGKTMALVIEFLWVESGSAVPVTDFRVHLCVEGDARTSVPFGLAMLDCLVLFGSGVIEIDFADVEEGAGKDAFGFLFLVGAGF